MRQKAVDIFHTRRDRTQEQHRSKEKLRYGNQYPKENHGWDDDNFENHIQLNDLILLKLFIEINR